jgi:hypothetical protein
MGTVAPSVRPALPPPNHAPSRSSLRASVPRTSAPCAAAPPQPRRERAGAARSFNEACGELVAADKMGFVVFQFQLSFAPGAKSEAAVLECRRRLDPRITMAVVRALPLSRRAPRDATHTKGRGGRVEARALRREDAACPVSTGGGTRRVRSVLRRRERKGCGWGMRDFARPARACAPPPFGGARLTRAGGRSSGTGRGSQRVRCRARAPSSRSMRSSASFATT